ncbi:hypothetical protein [Photorhabdus sp. CRCIA-P01]|uniref:hypothetical protein n=1 Tax=Photorhabdus sp. CRCIA-P01 TaxID=2019570 RepID=UPI000E599D86|nr:hypothetical protein [Photorhabdus sp. CRCIA-P01]
MHIQVAALRAITSERERHLPDRDPQQSITDYAQQHLLRRQTETEQALTALLQAKQGSAPLLITLPEFFWNIRWDALKTTDELHRLTDYYLDQLSSRVSAIVDKFPADKYGQIVLLAGTVATLVETAQKGTYEALNYALIAGNRPAAPEISMWPKRYTSWVDFGSQVGESGDIIACKLADSLVVAVLKTSTSAPEHRSADAYGAWLANDIIKACPFSINICLDYTRLSTGEQQKNQQNQNSKIDFLLACGEKLYDSHSYPASVQYAIRNDGINPGEIEFFTVKNQHISQKIEPVFLTPGLATATLDIT